MLQAGFTENNLCEVVRGAAGDLAEEASGGPSIPLQTFSGLDVDCSRLKRRHRRMVMNAAVSSLVAAIRFAGEAD